MTNLDVQAATPPPRAIPSRLYKFRSLDAKSLPFTEKIFHDNRLWYSQASHFNDPFDCNHHIEVEMSEAEWMATAAQGERKLSTGIFEMLGGLVGGLIGELQRPLVEQGKLAPEAAASAEKGRAFAAKFGAQGQVSLGGQRMTDLPRGRSDELNRKLRDAAELMRRGLDARFGVLSLSAAPDNLLMWSHYADSHRGICIELDTDAHATAFPNLEPVEYRDDAPSITQKFTGAMELLERVSGKEGEAALSHLLSREVSLEDVRAWFLHKAALWTYECEWRSLRSQPGAHRIPAAAISGVIVGCVDSERTLALIRPWLARRRRKVRLLRAVKRTKAFALDIVPVET